MKRWMAPLLAWAGITLSASALAWPDKPVKLVVPAPAGGSMDVVARLLAQHLSADIKQSVIVENRAGAGGAIGIQAMLQAPADGYTLMVTSNNVLVEIPHVMKLPYDALKDVKPIATFARSGLLLVSAPIPEVNDFNGLVARLKARQGKGSFASYSTGTASHYAGLILNQKLGMDLQHVPFPGSPPALLQVMGGQIDVMFDGIATSLPQIRAGKLRAIGMASARRSRILPEVPTVAEQGVPGFDVSVWYSVLAAAGTPAPIVQRLHAEFLRAMRAPEVKERIEGYGYDIVGMTPAETDAFIRAEIGRWGKVVRDSGATVN